MYEDENLRAITVFYVILGIIYILLELWSKIYSKIDELKPKRFASNNEYRILGVSRGYSRIFKAIHRDKKKFVFFDNYLLDVREFISSHPGGAFFIKETIGEDVGKYLNGSSSLPGYGPNYHDMSAFSFAKSMAISELGFENNVLTGSLGQERMEWEIVDKLKVCESTFCVVLSSEEWNLCRPAGFDWMGKHFLLTMSEVNQTRRYYSMVLTNLPNWQEPNLRNIRLYIKPYDNGKVSSYVTRLEVGSKILLKGPMGPGLMLDNIKPGNYLAFAGGTGILPFIDLVNSILLNEVPEGFLMSLYVSFSNEIDVFALDLLEAAAEKAPQSFKFIINVSSKGTENAMTSDKIRMLMEGQEKLRKVWVCGSSGFSGFIRKMLNTAEVPVKKIINL
jgi:ferredoxin-NADP reductase